MALRAAKELQDGDYVNLGFGIPTLSANFIPEGRSVTFQVESGALNVGGIAPAEVADHDLFNPGARPILPLPGLAFFDSADSFAMIRGGHLDVSIVGGFQVSEKGDLANWSRIQKGDRWMGILGGAMEVTSAKKVIVVIEHIDKDGAPKIVKECTLPLTRKGCVDLIITDVAVIEVTAEGLVLKEVAPGWTAEEVQAITEPKLLISPDLKEMEL